MKVFKLIFGRRGSRVWFIVTALVMALLIVVTTLASTVFFNLFCRVLTSRRPIYAEEIDPIYLVDEGHTSKQATLALANELVEEVCEEGFVLLKNDEVGGAAALPLATPVSDEGVSARPKISVFGKNSVNLSYGGSGSGGGDTGGARTIYESLEEAGYDVNPALRAFYEDNGRSGDPRSQNSSDLDSGNTVIISTGETPQSRYDDAVKNSYAEYNDAALIVLTRVGGEGFDLPRSMEGASERGASDHYLQLDENEAALIKAVSEANFDRVIVVLNVSASFEIGFIDESSAYVKDKGYDIDPSKIDAAVWMGYPGTSGVMALGRLLSGEVNFSGKTVDTWAKDFTKDPTWFNFGDNRIMANSAEGTAGGDQYTLPGANGAQDPQLYYFVDYEEGIYTGYRYYETRAASYAGAVEAAGETAFESGEAWYDDAVIFPFGYGLSYTEFTWEVTDSSSIEGVTISADGEYTVTVKVTNAGTRAGRDTVQLYAHAPYEEGGVEKAEVVLVDFAKTGVLEPGASEEVTLTFDPYLLASYDCYGLSDNGFEGYELEAGDGYALYVAENSHDRSREISFRSAEIRFETGADGEPIENLYTDTEDPDDASDLQLETQLSRADWAGTWPNTPTEAERSVTQDFIDVLKDTSTNNPYADEYDAEEYPETGAAVTLEYRDLLYGEDGQYLDEDGDGIPYVAYDDARWETFLDQLTYAELSNLFENGGFKTAEILRLGKPLTNDTDGPSGFVNFMDKTGTYWGTCYYCSETVMSSTWNTDTLYEIGRMIGNEGIWGANGFGNGMPYSGWYAPGVNLHRSPFGGRNFEYFSEDPLLTGRLAAAEVRGCQDKGVYCYVKHFAVNDQETHRSVTGLCTYLTEQSLRELYLRSFELVVKEGETRAIMSAFNRIGTMWAGGDYRLLTEILRNEWGFEGMVISDFNTCPHMNTRQMAYAGGDINLVELAGSAWSDEADTGDMLVLRRAAKNILYTVINSNAMNGEIVGYLMPVWQILLIVADCVVVAGLGVWGFFAIRKSVKKREET